MSSRSTYSDEFKSDAVNLVISSGRSPGSVAPELGISVTALKRWVQLHREGETRANGQPDDPAEPAKYKALEARPREVERENDFLKKCRRSSPKNNGRNPLTACSGE
ncbi:transposase [Arthrobacter sp. ATA002]|uniref:transposase n=1 Tax=Arthrobacter sp. ATA002 TaxID=2991715 RepID=UPI003FA4C725